MYFYILNVIIIRVIYPFSFMQDMCAYIYVYIVCIYNSKKPKKETKNIIICIPLRRDGMVRHDGKATSSKVTSSKVTSSKGANTGRGTTGIRHNCSSY